MPITSSQNLTYKNIVKLIEDKKYRIEQKLFWIDGANFVDTAIENNWKIDRLVFVSDKISTNFKHSILNKIPENKQLIFSEKLYSHLSTKKNIQGIGAVVEQKFFSNTILKGAAIVLENISNPGNLGTIIRNCVAFDIKNIYIINPSVDPFNSETVRATMSGLFFMNISIFEKISIFIEKLKEAKNYTLIGTSLQFDSINLRKYKKKYKNIDDVLILFGSEAKGMSDELKTSCHDLLKIEMSPNIDSLNIAESAAIILYELFGQNS